MKALNQPVYILTSKAPGGEPQGCLVGFATQASIRPGRFLACISRVNRTFAAASSAPSVAVHVLDPDRAGLARLFGGRSGDDLDKFSRCAWHEGPDGLPILDDCPGWLAGPVCARMDMGDHLGLLVEPEHAHEADGARSQLTVHDLADLEPGHSA